MEKILLQKQGRITRNDKLVSGSVIGLLGFPVRLGDQFTLASFFKLIHTYPEFKQINPVLKALYEIYEQSKTNRYKANDISGLCFYKTIEIIGFPGKPSLNMYTSLKGVARQTTKNLKFFHIETLLDHALALGKLKHIIFGDTEDVFQYETSYTLFEFVEGIAWELSFNFNPLQCSIRR